MAKRQDKKALRVKKIFEQVNNHNRTQWEYINQKGFDFSNDNQLTDAERTVLEEQGMPTFTVNRIAPVVEMLNFYVTDKKPRWQAVATEGSDTDIAAVFSDIADYIWDLSDGSTLYSNSINDAITKSIGYLMVTVDADSDNGMGDVKLKQPEPFDVFVDPKSRDMLFKDAAFIMIRKILPKEHLKKLYPAHATKIKKANSDQNSEFDMSEKSFNSHRKDFAYKDIDESESINPDTGESDELIEFYEMYEKVKIAYMNIFYQQPVDEKVLAQIEAQVKERMNEIIEELNVQMLEQLQKLEQALQQGAILEQRFQLEVKKLKEETQQKIVLTEEQLRAELTKEVSQIINEVVSEEEYKLLIKDKRFASMIIDAVKFYGTRLKQTLVAGDRTLGEHVFPENITEYPIVPFHYKWTGTPYPISAVSPLIGKQREINKAHQILIHNASLGSSLRWMHEEGSIDTDHWERYSSSPGALLPIRPGAAPPTPVQPAPLNSAFFQIVQTAKSDVEYLAGIYSSMQGDTSAQHETFRGLLAQDEYGTRRIKQWLNNFIEPGLKQIGKVVAQFSQSVYTAHKVFRVVQPSALQEDREVQINVPLYNDFGEAIGKWNDFTTAKFDVRIITGSTLPVNRWAYLAELKELLQLGVVDDIAVLSETDLRNKEKIAQRKSMLAQLQGQLQKMDESLKDKEGTIETLERQLVQAGIKGKVQDAEMEINKKKLQAEGSITKQTLQREAEEKFAGKVIKDSSTKIAKDREQHEQHIRNEEKREHEARIQQLEVGVQSILQNLEKDLDNTKE